MKHLKLVFSGLLACALHAQTGTTIAGGRTIMGQWDASLSSNTRPFRTVGADPTVGAACPTNDEVQWNPTTGRQFMCRLAIWIKTFDVAAGAGDVTLAGVQTLTNKSISASQINSGVLGAARGALGADSSAFAGVVKMASGVASVVIGTSTDCVMVNGTSGACGGLQLLIERISDTQIRIGNNCTVSTPCVINVGAKPYSKTAGFTATIAGAASGDLKPYFDAATGNFLVAHNTAATVTCAGCTTAGATATHPIDSRLLATIPFATNVFGTFSDTWNKQGSATVPKLVVFGPGMTGSSQTDDTLTLVAAIGGGSAYDPSDLTKFYRRVLMMPGFNAGRDYTYSSGCFDGNSEATGNGMDTISVTPWFWLKTTGDTTHCAVIWPYVQVWGGAIPDVFSGATPILHQSSARMGKQSINGGTSFVGWTQNALNLTNAFGCKSIGNGNWFTFINAAGAPIGTPADTGVASSTNSLKVKVSNGTTTAAANSVTCSINGTAVTQTGTIPPGTNWFFVNAVIQSGATPSAHRTSEFQIYFQGLP